MHALNNLLGRTVFTPEIFEHRRETVQTRITDKGHIAHSYKKTKYKGHVGSWCLTLAIDLLQKRGYQVTALPKTKITTATRRVIREGKSLLVIVERGLVNLKHAISAKHGFIYDSTKSLPMKADRKNLRILLPLVTHAYVVELK